MILAILHFNQEGIHTRRKNKKATKIDKTSTFLWPSQKTRNLHLHKLINAVKSKLKKLSFSHVHAIFNQVLYHRAGGKFRVERGGGIVPPSSHILTSLSEHYSNREPGTTLLLQRCTQHFGSEGAGKSVKGIICPPWFEQG